MEQVKVWKRQLDICYQANVNKQYYSPAKTVSWKVK